MIYDFTKGTKRRILNSGMGRLGNLNKNPEGVT
jgi:hypothetical protein